MSPVRQPVVVTGHQCGAGANQAVSISRNPDGSYLVAVGGEGDDEVTVLLLTLPFAGARPGLTNEALVAIAADRLRVFQAGPRACRANAEAIGHLEQALAALHRRELAPGAKDR